MQKLVNDYLTATDENGTLALNKIIDFINANPLQLKNFKSAFISTGKIEDHLGAIYTVMKGLDFIPELSTPSSLPPYVYRGAGISPIHLLEMDGFKATGKSKNIVTHQIYTGESIYVSTSKILQIALEHAFQHQIPWVYKIEPRNGICVNEFLAPAKMHEKEEEVIFTHHLPVSQIVGVAIAEEAGLATDFFPLDDDANIISALKNLGLAY